MGTTKKALFFLTADPAIKKKILIGGLFSITGGWSTLGNSSAAALQLAAKDVNAYFDRAGLNFEVQPIVEDTQLVPQTALEKLQTLSKLGVRIVVGPQSSDSEILISGRSATCRDLCSGRA